jgi:hypothetical protein
MTAVRCGRPSCSNLGTKTCSACNTECYCRPECQKKDWKSHKIMCSCMKNSDTLLSTFTVHDKLAELRKQSELRNGTEEGRRILEFCVSFAEYQFGDRLIRKSYHDADWEKDIGQISSICYALGNEYSFSTNDMDMNDAYKDAFRKAIHYFEKALSILQSWRTYFDLEASGQVLDDTDKRAKINNIYDSLSNTENSLSTCYTHLNDYVNADNYSDRAISHAKLVVIDATYDKSMITERLLIDNER